MPNGGVHNPKTLNLYAYVSNNPIKLNDPTGMSEKQSVTCAVEKEGITRTYQMNGVVAQKGDSFWSIAKEEIESMGGSATGTNITNTAKAIQKANGYKTDVIHPGDKIITGFYQIGMEEKGLENSYPELWFLGGAKAGQLTYKGVQMFLGSETGIKFLLWAGAGSIGASNAMRYGKDKLMEGFFRISNVLLTNPQAANEIARGTAETVSPWVDTADMSMPTTPAGQASGLIKFVDVMRENLRDMMDKK